MTAADRPHGPLPVLLVCLTIVTGLVDAFSYLRLGHVFVANMTGNVVFLGFALAGVGEISILASLLAVLAFAIGAAVGCRTSGAPWAPPGCRHLGSGGRRSRRSPHRKHRRGAGLTGSAAVDRVARAGNGRPKRCGPLTVRTRPDNHSAHLDRDVSGRGHHTPMGAWPASGLGPGDAGWCADRRSCCAGSPLPLHFGWRQYFWSHRVTRSPGTQHDTT